MGTLLSRDAAESPQRNSNDGIVPFDRCCGVFNESCLLETPATPSSPDFMEKHPVHMIVQNHFKLYGLPIPRPGEILGLIGGSSLGKSTILQILTGRLKPNLGHMKIRPEWEDVFAYLRDSELSNYFAKVQKLRGPVGEYFHRQIPESERTNTVFGNLDLAHIFENKIENLSGGDLQLFCCAAICAKEADLYIFDEPFTYLDVKQRFNVARAIRALVRPDKYIVVAGHDLSVLEYLSDSICCINGIPGIYGKATAPCSVREGVNIFLDECVPGDELDFRKSPTVIQAAAESTFGGGEDVMQPHSKEYPSMMKCLGEFKLKIEAGSFTAGEIIVLLGENGSGKSTFFQLVGGYFQQCQRRGVVPEVTISYKPQMICPKYTGTVRALLDKLVGDAYTHAEFAAAVMNPLNIEDIMDRGMQSLTGAEVQRVALALCLGKSADVYLIDEPSFYLSCEERFVAARVLKSFIENTKKTAFIVEHDFTMATYLADRIIVFEGQPSRETIAKTPQSLVFGLNRFLELIGITCRRDSKNFRPHVNKEYSAEDLEQKRSGNYFVLED